MIELGYNYFHWFRRHYFLYIFGFLVNLKPINLFVQELMLSQRNITYLEYREYVQPISGYVALGTSILIFIFISFCAFNHVLSIVAIGGLVFSVALWQNRDVTELQVAEGFLGCVLGSEFIYYATIYVSHDVKNDFIGNAASIRAVPLLAKLVSGIFAQAVVTNHFLSLEDLAFISVPFCGHAIFIMIHLPLMCELDEEEFPETFKEKTCWFKIKIKELFSDFEVLKLSLWCAFTMSGYAQITTSFQAILSGTKEEGDNPYNGAFEGISSFLALLGVLICRSLKMNFTNDTIFLCVTSLIQSGLLFGFATVGNTLEYVVFYILLNIIYHFMMTAVTAKIARNVYDTAGLGITFGFIGLVYSILNVIFISVVNNNGIFLTTLEEFLVYGAFHLVIAVMVLILALIK